MSMEQKMALREKLDGQRAQLSDLDEKAEECERTKVSRFRDVSDENNAFRMRNKRNVPSFVPC
jgi:hypothetical protein